MKVSTRLLIGRELDYAVARIVCDAGWLARHLHLLPTMPFSTDWHQGGPIIEREITKLFKNLNGTYTAQIRHEQDHPLVAHKVLAGWTNRHGPTPLIAAMRCYVASHFGDEVEIPEELLK